MTDHEDIVKYFAGICGDGLTRPPKGFPADLPHMEDIKRKSFFAMRRETAHGIAASPAFLNQVADIFEAATPLMTFICDALEVPF